MVPGYLSPVGIQGPADEHQLVQTICSYHGLGSLGPQLKGKCLLFHCNNVSVVHIMAKASTHSKTMMAFVHTFTLLSMQHNIHVCIWHIMGVNNDIADILSHFKMDRFQQLCPHAEVEPLPMVNIW